MANPTTGFVNRVKGKGLYSAACLMQFGIGGALFRNGGNIYSNQNAAGIASLTNTTNEVTLDTFSLPANSLDVAGRALTIYAFGTYANNNAHTKSATVYFGAEKFTASTTLTGPIGWAVMAVVQKDAANSQTMNSQVITGGVSSGCQTQSGSETDTAAIVLKVTGQSSVATTGDVVLYGWAIEGLD